MFRYPKMPSAAGAKLGSCIAFEKLDGTNLHWEWHRGRGWWSFGTRSAAYPYDTDGETAFATRHPGLEEAPGLFRRGFASQVEPILSAIPNASEAIVFTEFLGPNSFAGMHKADDPKRLVLFDVRLTGTGFLGPQRFLTLFGHLPVPRVVFHGRFSGKLTEAVRAGKYQVGEGVVIKGGSGGNDVWMAKVKTTAYVEKLKAMFGARWEEYWE